MGRRASASLSRSRPRSVRLFGADLIVAGQDDVPLAIHGRGESDPIRAGPGDTLSVGTGNDRVLEFRAVALMSEGGADNDHVNAAA